MRVIFGLILFLSISAFALFQLYAGFVGINYYFGILGVCVAFICIFILRFTLPLTIGAFFAAYEVWHWHWFLALLFVSPGLMLLIPGTLLMILSRMRNLVPKKKNPKDVIIEGEVDRG